MVERVARVLKRNAVTPNVSFTTGDALGVVLAEPRETYRTVGRVALAVVFPDHITALGATLTLRRRGLASILRKPNGIFAQLALPFPLFLVPAQTTVNPPTRRTNPKLTIGVAVGTVFRTYS